MLAASGMAIRPIDREGAGDVMASTPSGFLPTGSMRMYVDILNRGAAFYTGGEGAECDFSKIKVPVAVWIGEEDCVLDVDGCVSLLEDVVAGPLVHKRVLEGYGHCDMWYSLDSIEQVTPDIRSVIEKYCERTERTERTERAREGGVGKKERRRSKSSSVRRRSKSRSRRKSNKQTV